MRVIGFLLVILALTEARSVSSSGRKYPDLDRSRKGERVLEEPMTAFLYCVRDLMTSGLPEFDVPSFNPLRINATSIELGAFGICTGQITVEDFVVSFFDTFEVSYISGVVGLIPPRFELVVELTWNVLDLVTKYDLTCESQDDVVFGSGSVEAETTEVRSLIDFVVRILPEIDMQGGEFWLSMDHFNSFRITGLRGDEEHSAAVSQYIYENGPQILQDLDPFISDLFDALLSLLFDGDEGVQEGGLIDHLVTTCLVM